MVAEQQKDFSSIRGTDLDSLTSEDFEAIRIWLDGRPTVRKQSSPRPYQQRTLAAVLPSLNQQDRATTVMACGTGKTFVALWVAEAIAKRTVLVLVPSLPLLRQTLREWVKYTVWEPFDYLCVCSDPTVSQGDDESVMRATELVFSVSTKTGHNKGCDHPRQIAELNHRLAELRSR